MTSPRPFCLVAGLTGKWICILNPEFESTHAAHAHARTTTKVRAFVHDGARHWVRYSDVSPALLGSFHTQLKGIARV